MNDSINGIVNVIIPGDGISFHRLNHESQASRSRHLEQQSLHKDAQFDY